MDGRQAARRVAARPRYQPTASIPPGRTAPSHSPRPHADPQDGESRVISATGIWLGYLAYTDQQAINSAQRILNERQEERTRLRYAEHVAYWDEAKDRNRTVVYVQNRAPVPLRDVNLFGGPAVAEITKEYYSIGLGGIPPCTLVSLQIDWTKVYSSPPEVWRSDWYTVKMLFRDPVSLWIYSSELGVQPATIEQSGLPIVVISPGFRPDEVWLDPTDYRKDTVRLPVKIEPVADCGQSG
jgi:hypothetical protein